MTQAQLAARIGVIARTVQNYEAGTTWPESDRLAKIAEALGRPVEWFFASDDESVAA